MFECISNAFIRINIKRISERHHMYNCPTLTSQQQRQQKRLAWLAPDGRVAVSLAVKLKLLSVALATRVAAVARNTTRLRRHHERPESAARQSGQRHHSTGMQGHPRFWHPLIRQPAKKNDKQFFK